MIKIRKGKEPKYLNDNKHKSTCRYNDPKVKTALVIECSNKCIYCEVALIASSGQVEHIKPVDVFPKDKLKWKNLGLACQPCNREKGEKYFKHCLLLNPYIDDPEDHLVFYGPMLLEKSRSSRGEITIKEILLNRKELLQDRSEKIEEIQGLVRRYVDCSNHSIKMMLLDEIFRQITPDKEYSLCVKHFVLNSLLEDIDFAKKFATC